MKNLVKINFHLITVKGIVDHIIQDQTQIKVILKIEEILITLTHIRALILNTHLLKSMITGKKNPTNLKKWTIVKVTAEVRVRTIIE